MDEPSPLPSWKVLLVIVAVLVLIVIGIFQASKFYTPSEPSRLVYNNFEFKKSEGFWHTQWQQNEQVYNVSLRFNPKEVETVTVSGRLNDTFRRQPFYLTFDPDANQSDFKYLALGFSEFGLSIVRAFGGTVESACTKNMTGVCDDHAIVTCADDDKAVVYFRSAPEPRVTLDGNCLTLEGKELDLIKAIDRVLYHFYKIMP